MKTALFVLLIALATYADASAQNSAEEPKKKEAVKYLPIHKFPLAIQHAYIFTDTTEVLRTLPDETKTKYTRIVTHFFTVKENENPKDGFVTVEVTIDSTKYYIREGKAEIYWDSQDESAGGVNMQDLMYSTVPLGKFFDMTYSPYGEIAKISGEKMDAYFDYLNQNASGFNDEVVKFLWYDGASLPRLASITNVRKINFPTEKMERDSIWRTPFSMQFDNINFFDTVDARITDVRDGEMTIEAISKSLDAIPGKYLFYGIKDMLLPVTNTTGMGFYKMTMSPRGAMKSAYANFDINLSVPVRKENFGINIKSKVSWVLQGQFRQ